MRSDRLADKTCCQVAAADLLGDHAKKMEAVEVVWVYRENFPVVVLGFRELARLVMPLPSSQQLTNLVRGTNSQSAEPQRACPSWLLFAVVFGSPQSLRWRRLSVKLLGVIASCSVALKSKTAALIGRGDDFNAKSEGRRLKRNAGVVVNG